MTNRDQTPTDETRSVIDVQHQERFIGVPAVSGSIATLLGLLGLLGWVTGVRVLSSVRLDYIPMAPDTAVDFILFGAILFVKARGALQRRPRIAVSALLGLAVIYSFLKFVEYFAQLDLTFEGVLFPITEKLGSFPLGRMSPVTGLLFFFSGLALSLSLRRRSGRVGQNLSSVLGALVFASGFIATVGYLFATPLLYGSNIIPLALTTALGFLFLGGGLIATSPDSALGQLFFAPSIRARLMRAFFPLTLSAILIQGLLQKRFGANDALLSAVLTLIFMALTAWVILLVSRIISGSISRVEAALQSSEAGYRRLFETAQDGIMILNTETGLIDDVNPCLTSLLGTSREQLVGKPIFDISPFKQAAAGTASLLELQQGQQMRFEDLQLETFDHRQIYVEVASNAYSVNGIKAIQFNLRDISARKQAEKQQQETQSRFIQAQKMESVGQLAGGVAHDFNNMLQVISSYAEIAMMKMESSHATYKYLSQIREAAARSADITRQLLAFARKQTISPRVIDLNDAVSKMLKLLQRLIGDDIEILWKPSPVSWLVRIDPSQVDQILANLSVNARDAISQNGRLTIETENVVFDGAYCMAHPGSRPGEYVMMAVSDNGSGMNKETLSHVFEPFFTTKGVGKGTGLGTATIFGIVKQNEGYVGVYSEPGVGTTFRIYLPRFEGEMLQTQTEQPELPRGTETVLVVEDEAGILELSRQLLEQLGYTVLTASSPKEAIRLFEERGKEVDLLISDVVMPEMNGRELVQRIGAMKAGLKYLFMSGYTADVIANQGVLDEAVNFIQKPFSIQQLAAKVREALKTP
jgi:PAS domain S-box-containing protein